MSSEPPASTRDGYPSTRWLRVYGPIVPRDTDKTPFTIILDELIERVPGSYAAAIVDNLGETVDYAGRGDPFDLRIAAAHLQLVIHGLVTFAKLGDPRWIVIRGVKKSVAATALPNGYALCILLRPRAAFTISMRALKSCMRALALEAGWDDDAAQTPPPPLVSESSTSSSRARAKPRAWFPINVVTDHRGRPSAIAGRAGGEATAAAPVEVLGAVMGLAVRERGYRVRTAGGAELMLVREPGPRWYADEPI